MQPYFQNLQPQPQRGFGTGAIIATSLASLTVLGGIGAYLLLKPTEPAVNPIVPTPPPQSQSQQSQQKQQPQTTQTPETPQTVPTPEPDPVPEPAKVEPPKPAPLTPMGFPPGTFFIRSVRNPDLVLDINNASKAAQTEAIVWTYQGSDNQQYTADRQYLKPNHSGLILTAGKAGDPIVQMPEIADAELAKKQSWMLMPDGAIKLRDENICMDVAGNSTATGTKVIGWGCSGADNQKWTIVPQSNAASTFTPVKTQTQASLCYDAPKPGYECTATMCTVKDCPSGFANAGLFCTKPRYDRGVGTPKTECNPGDVKMGGLCYTIPQGYKMDVQGTVYKPCENGWRSDGTTCWIDAKTVPKEKVNCPGYDLACCYKGNGRCPDSTYVDNGCVCTRNVQTKSMDVHPINGYAPTRCADGKVFKDGACYSEAKPGYTCNATTCSADCPSGWESNGVSCKKPSYDRGVGKPC
uniref:Hemagglutinin n=1 Tax=Clandestinovirus TaxID=2831644 RepID=A0A8F8KL79_9VIRU|nr:hemagglutinin [Clandestinovirus]